jgi:hypothetical protein
MRDSEQQSVPRHSAADAATLPKPRTRRTGRWIRRIILGILLVLIGVPGMGALYQSLATIRDQRNLPAPGRLVEVNGYRLHLQIMGSQRDGPTVLLDAAAGSTAAQWGWIQPQVAAFTQVVAYDRPGQGYSDPPPTPRKALGAAPSEGLTVLSAPFILSATAYEIFQQPRAGFP